MTSVDTIIETVLSEMPLDLVIYAVEVVDGDYKVYTENTFYFKLNSVLTISGVEYTVVDFTINQYLTLSGASAPVNGSYPIPAPTYIYGKYKEVNKEISRLQDISIMPLIWRFDIQTRTTPAARDSINESEGNVRLFFNATNNPENYTTETDYNNVLNPLNSFIEYFLRYLQRNNRVNKTSSITSTYYSKFVNGGTGTTTDDGQRVFNKNVSAIEVNFPLSIIKSLVCTPRVIPIVEGEGFSSGFSDGFN